MVAYKLTLDPVAVRGIGQNAAAALVVVMMRRVLNRAIVLTPVKTGNLRGHNKSRILSRGLVTAGEVFNDANYARAVHNGSRAHTIKAKHARALRFEINGEVVYAKSVKIPKRKGRPWLYRALSESARRRGWTVTKL